MSEQQTILPENGKLECSLLEGIRHHSAVLATKADRLVIRTAVAAAGRPWAEPGNNRRLCAEALINPISD